MNKKEELIVHWDDSKYLIISSMFFIPTSILSYIRYYYLYSFIMGITFLCSINYWRKASYGKRRTIDIIMSRLSFCFNFYNGIIHLHGINLFIGLFNAGLMYYFYKNSNYLFYLNNKNWLKCHFFFHFLVGIQSLIIVYHLPPINLQ